MELKPFLAAGALLLCAAALDRRVLLRRYAIRSERIQSRVRLAVASDLHSEPSARRRSHLVALLRTLKPDAVLLPGDTVDRARFLGGAPKFIRAASMVAPVYASIGNHEGRSDELDRIRDVLSQSGATLLHGTWVQLRGNILLSGIDDPASPQYCDRRDWAEQARRAFKPLREERSFRVLLSHRPDLTRTYASLPFDLVLSGHAHGGQVRLPGLINGLYAPDQGIFPPFAGGLYRHGTTLHIVSRGLAVNHRPRVFNRPELVVIDLLPKTKYPVP